MRQARPFPQLIVSRKGARDLKAGRLWVYEGEVRAIEPAPATGELPSNGCVVDIREENGTYQGTGLLSEQSMIRARVVSRNANDRFDEAFWARKLAWAWEYRRTVMGSRALPGTCSDLQACRVIYSEADGFPGLVVDRYGQVLVAQVGTYGMERLRPVLYPLLLSTLQEAGEDVRWIYERNDGQVRDKEGLPRYQGFWEGCLESGEQPSPLVTVAENGISFALDLEHSQKTGFFLDQKYNRRAVRRIAAGKRVLDAFCHVGPFGLNAAAGGAAFVRCVDVSETACGLAKANAHLNGLDERMGFTGANVLDYLPRLRQDRNYLREEGGPFDLIVLDPPAFTKSRGTANSAARGYKEINREALRLLPRGGYLATCSCSHFMPTERLASVIAEAAHEAGVSLRQVEARQQAPDHPILVGMPETEYLKFFIYQVV